MWHKPSIAVGHKLLTRTPELVMNRRDDRAGPLFVTNACDEGRSRAYGRLSKDLLRTKEQAEGACLCVNAPVCVQRTGRRRQAAAFMNSPG